MRQNGMKRVGLIVSILVSVFMVLPAGAALSPGHEVAAAGTGSHYIVKFTGPIMNQWVDALRSMGVDIITYVPPNSYEVVSPVDPCILDAQPFVMTTTEYPNSMKISPDITDATRDVTITFVDVGSMGASVDQARSYLDVFQEGKTHTGYIMKGTLRDPSLVNDIAALPDVHFIAPYAPEHLHDEVGMQIVGGGAWYMDDDSNPSTPYRALGDHGAYVNQLGWTGSGVTVGLADTGLGDGTTPNAGHNDFTGRVIGGMTYGTGGWGDGHGHGTHCAGLATGNTYGGNGITYAGHGPYYVAMGLAYDANIYAQKIFSDTGSWIGPADYYTILKDGYNGGDDIHSNSWGSSTYGSYDAHDEAYDHAVRDADDTAGGNQMLTITVSAGNDGSGTNTIGSPGNSKNVITVGSVENYMPDTANYGNLYDANSDADNPDQVSSFSSRGWTDDGRIKPDVMAPGQATLSTHSPIISGSNLYGLYSADNRYEWCSGTSQANPTVAGGAAVVYGWYQSTYGVPPTPSMTKALIINTAVDMGTADIPNQNEGWGRMYLPTIVNPPAPFILKDTEPELTTGQTHTFTFSYANAAEPLKITLAYIDRYALSGANPTLQNQVNLEVVTPLGTIYHGNAFSGGWSTTGNPPATFDTDGDGYDDRNNVECVYIPPGSLETGQYTVRVIGTDIPADCDFDGTNDQDYSLVIYNGQDVTSQGTVDLDKNVYVLEDTATVTVKDADLNTNSNVQTTTVTVTSDTEPAGESVLLTETGGDTGIFTGTLTLSATDGAGILQVSHGDTVTATYYDADDGTGSPATVTDTATVDGQVQPPSSLTVDWWGTTTGTAIDEDFSGGIPADWTIVDGGSGGGAAATWTTSNPGSRSASAPISDPFAIVDSDNAGTSATQDEQMITGILNLASATSVTLEFDQYFYYYSGGGNEYGDVDVRSANTGGTWTNVFRNNGASSPNPDHQTIDISTQAAGASDVQIRFYYYGGNYDWYWQVDNVLVTYSGGGTTSDNLLNWTLSGDDGAGANDVTQYNIYRADNSGGPWDAGAYIASVPAGTDTYTDAGKGEPDGIIWWYVVRAEDAVGNEDPNTNAVPEPGGSAPQPYDIDLTGFGAGDWVFVSFAYPMSSSVQDMLNDATLGDGQTTWDTVKWWDATDAADPWKTYNPAKPAGLNDLATVDETMGVWLHLTANGGDQFLTTGSTGDYSGSSVSIPLYTGWNLVGYPSATSRLASSTLPAQADLVAYYDNAAPYLVTDAAPNTVTFSEGNAYWVHVTADTTWNVAP